MLVTQCSISEIVYLFLAVTRHILIVILLFHSIEVSQGANFFNFFLVRCIIDYR